MLPERVHKERQMRPCSIHVCSIITCGPDTDNEINQIFFSPTIRVFFSLGPACACMDYHSLFLSPKTVGIAIYLSVGISLWVHLAESVRYM